MPVFAHGWQDEAIVQQAVGQLPWVYNVVLLTQLKKPMERCYIIIELKAGNFKPEHLGQLGFYLTAVDRQIKTEHDTPTIGLLLCKNKNKVVAEYALGDSNQPMGIAEYKPMESLPTNLQTQFSSIEEIEPELQEINGE